MPTTLCLDFGNTRLKAAVFKNEQQEAILTIEKEDKAAIEQLLTEYRPEFSILSSVINHQRETEALLQLHTRFHRLHHNSILPITTPVAKPETIGADRLALCAAAAHLFPKQNNLIIGLGSCITYNFLNLNHQFMGGAISPGMEMRFKSMHHYTALLPLVKPDWNFPLIGYDTKTNILSGVAWGMAKEIDGIIEAYEEKFDRLNILLTGGDTLHFAPLLKKRIFADPHLMFKGLYAISLCNR